MTEQETIEHQEEMATTRKQFIAWWNEHFSTSENFNNLSVKHRMDFQAVAWRAWLASKSQP